MATTVSGPEPVRSGKQILLGILAFLLGTTALVFAVKYFMGL